MVESCTDLPLLEDVEVAYLMIIKTLKDNLNIKGVFQSQIYSILTEKTDISEQLGLLRQSNKFKLLNCKNFGLTDFFLISTSEYVQYLLTCADQGDAIFNNACQKYIHFIKRSSNISISRIELCKQNVNYGDNMRDEELQSLLSAGFLSRRRDASEDFYFISHPNLGKLIQIILDCRKKVLSYIRKRKLKEIEYNQLLVIMGDKQTMNAMNNDGENSNQIHKRRRVSKSGLILQEFENSVLNLCSAIGPRFILHDLLGSNLVSIIDLPDGKRLLRLPPTTDK